MKVLDKPTDALFHRFVSGETYKVSSRMKGNRIVIEGDEGDILLLAEAHDIFFIPSLHPYGYAVSEVFTSTKPKTKNYIKAEIHDRSLSSEHVFEVYLVPVKKRWKWG